MDQQLGPKREVGFVSLIGAGPGAPDLLTLRAVRTLERAEVILQDALLEPGLAEFFPKGATVISVGKRCGKPSMAQVKINESMLFHARAGRRVVRLKGGDPLLFGRGGEEALALAAADIPFEVIPGVSAVLAAGAATGIPLTHRGLSRELRILEGHHLLEDPATDWQGLARTTATLALYMGTRSLPAVARRLLAHGAAPERPVALVERAQCTGETLTLSTLRLAAEGRLSCRTEGPGLVLMGDVIRARATSPFLEHPHGPAAPLPQPGEPARTPRGCRDRRAG